ncbi:MAG TPA: hemerythrin domain-containing protein [Labilithrix sp.]|nr:hemerythrin domain-containing protein [Labilithrix sp.]
MELDRIPATLDDVRLAIFRQHTQLAQLCDELEEQANAVLAGSDDAGHVLRRDTEQFCARFARHLAYAETELERWLPAAATSAREILLGGHDDLRESLDGLLHDRAVFADPRAVAKETLALVHVVRKHMVAEDAALRALG